MTLQNKNILITGGTSALGSAFSRLALGEGAQVTFTYYQVTEKAIELEKLGAQGFKVDLSDTQALMNFFKAFKAEHKELDVLIHNAASVRDRTVSKMTEEEWDHVLATDLKAPALLTKKCLPLLFKNPYSKVFFITSRAAFHGAFGTANYAAAKAGLLGLTKSLAKEYGRKKLLVNAINPGFMLSSMTEDLPEEVKEKNKALNPTGQFSDPEEVAKFIAFLSSDEMIQVTGQVISYEGRLQ